MRNQRLRTIAEIGLTLALFAVFAMIKLTLPFNIAGGSVSLSILPLVILAIVRGPAVGLTAGALAGVIDYILEPYAVSALQVLLDYPIAFGVVGLAGLLSAFIYKSQKEGKTLSLLFGIAGAAFIGGLARTIVHFLSGIIFFAENLPAGKNLYIWSASYQMSYMLPSTIAAIILSVLIVPILVKRVSAEEEN